MNGKPGIEHEKLEVLEHSSGGVLDAFWIVNPDNPPRIGRPSRRGVD